jgi:hypothetical protein
MQGRRRGIVQHFSLYQTFPPAHSTNSQTSAPSKLPIVTSNNYVAHNGNTQIIFNIQFMLLILLAEFFSGRILCFPTEMFPAEVLISTGIYFQQKFIFNRNLFSNINLFSTELFFSRN